MGGGPPTTDATSSSRHMVSEQSTEQLEEASPISYRPPAIGNSDELMRFASGEGDEVEGGGGGGGAGGVSIGGNRWPRQETIALLKIRSDMDTVFRDATIKGPLWEDVSRKLAELGYKRSAKKCREKFENVQKYYKRTKDGRAGRQDGKSYKFFSELEALHHTTATLSKPVSPPATASLDVAPISVGIPMPISSVRISPTTADTLPTSESAPLPTPAPLIATATTTANPFGISSSSNSSSSSQGFEKDEDELGGEPSNMAGTSRKRKRKSSSREDDGGGSGSSSSSKRMIELFEGLMKQVMQKQEALQQMFLEAIEKREQDRMIREEGWKRQEMARLAREHELIAQERALASSRDAAIVSFLQKFTGQTVQLPSSVTIPAVPPPQTQPAATVVAPPAPIPTAAPPSVPHHHQQQPEPKQSHSQHQNSQQQHQPDQNTEVVKHNQQAIASEVIMAIPEQKVSPQEIGGNESMEPASSRWPKAEVLALINIRSGLETRYQEAGPKGPLWEEISAAMCRMGYKRNPKRCKEKWENINKYYKKVKESNKKRPEDAKTCPYFHQLDALYNRKKLLGGGSSSFSVQSRPLEGETSQAQQQHQDPPSDAPTITQQLQQQPTHDQSENITGVAAKKSEDMVREMMEEQ